MLNLVKPRYVMPFHGDFKRLRLHAPAGRSGRHRTRRTSSRATTGCRSTSTSAARASASASSPGMIFVDGVEIGDMADVALRDRRMLSADGIFIVVVTIAEQDGRSVADPEVIFRGVPFLDAGRRAASRRSARPSSDSLRGAAEEEIREVDLLQQMLHDDLAKLVYDRLKRRPMVLPVVVEV